LVSQDRTAAAQTWHFLLLYFIYYLAIDTRGWQRELSKLDKAIGSLLVSADREIWLLNIIGEMLNTTSMLEVKSWLVSANCIGFLLITLAYTF
jgi:hypothetical protein